MQQMHRLARAAGGLWGAQRRGGWGKSSGDLIFDEENAECRESATSAVWWLPPLLP